MKEHAMRVAIYCRVSTDGQEREGTSLDEQEEVCRRHAARLGAEVVACISESASGYTLARPGLIELRQLLRAGKLDAIISTEVDRLSRHLNQMGALFDEVETAGVQLVLVREPFENTPVGRFILAARAFSAEVEREKIIARTTRGKLRRAQQGQLVQGTGRGLYGYVLSPRGQGGDGRRTIHPEQAAVVRRIFRTFVQGRSVHAIAQDLNREGIETLQGWETDGAGHRLRRISWHPLTVRRILVNETYMGRTVYRRTKGVLVTDPRSGKRKRQVVTQPEENWVEVPGATPPIIERALWLRAQELLTDSPFRQRRGQAIYPYSLAGHVRCSACQGSLSGSTLSGGPGRNRIRYYGCRNRNLLDRASRCPSKYVRAEVLERRLVAGLRQVLADPAEIVSAYNYLRVSASTLDEGALAQARKRLATAEQQVKRLARLARLADDEEVADALAEELKLAVKEKQAAQRVLDRLTAEQHPLPQIVADPASLAELSERVAAWLDPADKEKMELALEGLDVTVWAGVGEPTATGSLPVHATCDGNSHADVRSVVIKALHA
jgi:site-specific DNA recombinase